MMFAKIKNYQNQIPWNSLRDMRTIGQVIFVVIVLLVTWSGIKAIQTNYNLKKQISSLQQQNAVDQLKDNNLSLQNSYYNTDQFLDISARSELGLGLPGEKELLVPENFALSQLAPEPATAAPPTSKANNGQPWYEKNFESWMDFFLHRSRPDN